MQSLRPAHTSALDPTEVRRRCTQINSQSRDLVAMQGVKPALQKKMVQVNTSMNEAMDALREEQVNWDQAGTALFQASRQLCDVEKQMKGDRMKVNELS